MEKFKWSPKMIGLSLGMVGLLVGLVQGVLIRYINPKLATRNRCILALLYMHWA